MFNVYDEVWIMQNNKPTRKIVFAVIESMDFNQRRTETYLQLVDSKLGAGWGNNEGSRFSDDDVFTDKKTMIECLYDT